jgi:hypothetical protein
LAQLAAGGLDGIADPRDLGLAARLERLDPPDDLLADGARGQEFLGELDGLLEADIAGLGGGVGGRPGEAVRDDEPFARERRLAAEWNEMGTASLKRAVRLAAGPAPRFVCDARDVASPRRIGIMAVSPREKDQK